MLVLFSGQGVHAHGYITVCCLRMQFFVVNFHFAIISNCTRKHCCAVEKSCRRIPALNLCGRLCGLFLVTPMQPGLPLSFLNWGRMYARGSIFWAYSTPGVSIFSVFRTPSLLIFGVILGLLKATKMYRCSTVILRRKIMPPYRDEN